MATAAALYPASPETENLIFSPRRSRRDTKKLKPFTPDDTENAGQA
jgi:hypothetical protein